MAESYATDGHILWNNCAPGVYLDRRKVIFKHNLLPNFLNNNFSVSVTFVSDASLSGSGTNTFYTFYSKDALKDSGLLTSWRLAHEPTTCLMVEFLAPPGPIDYQGTTIDYSNKDDTHHDKDHKDEYKANHTCLGT